jgi:hypothetical protein
MTLNDITVSNDESERGLIIQHLPEKQLKKTTRKYMQVSWLPSRELNLGLARCDTGVLRTQLRCLLHNRRFWTKLSSAVKSV